VSLQTRLKIDGAKTTFPLSLFVSLCSPKRRGGKPLETREGGQTSVPALVIFCYLKGVDYEIDFQKFEKNGQT
jgi:hypothetical protein